jgi:hypothetical membrane protein
MGYGVERMERAIEAFGAAAGLLSVLSFIILTSSAVLNYPGYNPSVNYLSDLGAAPGSSAFFNGGVALSGICGIVFSLFIWKRFPAGPAKAGAFLFGAGLAFFAMTALFTEESFIAHFLFTGLFFALSIISFASVGIGLLGRSRLFGLFSLLMAALILPFPLSGLHPLAECLAAGAVLLWVLAMLLWAWADRKDEAKYIWLWS